jgi:hypothetical protein
LISRGYVQEKIPDLWKYLDGCDVSSGIFSSSFSESKEKLTAGSGIETFIVRHWTNSRWYILVLHCPIFLLGNPFLKIILDLGEEKELGMQLGC